MLPGHGADNTPAVVVDQWLYIDGGEYYLLVDGSPSPVSSEFIPMASSACMRLIYTPCDRHQHFRG
jgi:hypothetical protein